MSTRLTQVLENVTELTGGSVLVRPVRPEGAFTNAEYRAHVGLADSQARRRLKTLVDAGKLEKAVWLEGGKRIQGWILVTGQGTTSLADRPATSSGRGAGRAVVGNTRIRRG